MPHSIDRLLEIMALLRDPERGCPWDVEQTFETIAPHTIEEAYEVVDAIDRKDLTSLKDELGDLLLQVVFHAQMAREAGGFDFEAVTQAICNKLVRRHPHVFGSDKIADSAAQTAAWERQKAVERAEKKANSNPDAPPAGTVLDDIAASLPALARGLKLQKRAALVGFDWPDARSALEKFTEEVDELTAEMTNDADPQRLQDEIGDLLFTCINVSRKLNVDPETALRHANAKFERRFRKIEALLAADSGKQPQDVSLDELEALWARAKAED
jgi:ATP diphosphatase